MRRAQISPRRSRRTTRARPSLTRRQRGRGPLAPSGCRCRPSSPGRGARVASKPRGRARPPRPCRLRGSSARVVPNLFAGHVVRPGAPASGQRAQQAQHGGTGAIRRHLDARPPPAVPGPAWRHARLAQAPHRDQLGRSVTVSRPSTRHAVLEPSPAASPSCAADQGDRVGQELEQVPRSSACRRDRLPFWPARRTNENGRVSTAGRLGRLAHRCFMNRGR